MKLPIRLICIILVSIAITSCCHYETVRCFDARLPIVFQGFDKSDLSTVQINFLKKASSSRIVLSSYQIDSSQIYPYAAAQYSVPVVGTDTADIEVYLPSLSRTYLITNLIQKDKRLTVDLKVCRGLGDKIDLNCYNYFTSYTLDGVPGSLDTSGAMVLLVK